MPPKKTSLTISPQKQPTEPRSKSRGSKAKENEEKNQRDILYNQLESLLTPTLFSLYEHGPKNSWIMAHAVPTYEQLMRTQEPARTGHRILTELTNLGNLVPDSDNLTIKHALTQKSVTFPPNLKSDFDDLVSIKTALYNKLDLTYRQLERDLLDKQYKTILEKASLPEDTDAGVIVSEMLRSNETERSGVDLNTWKKLMGIQSKYIQAVNTINKIKLKPWPFEPQDTDQRNNYDLPDAFVIYEPEFPTLRDDYNSVTVKGEVRSSPLKTQITNYIQHYLNTDNPAPFYDNSQDGYLKISESGLLQLDSSSAPGQRLYLKTDLTPLYIEVGDEKLDQRRWSSYKPASQDTDQTDKLERKPVELTQEEVGEVIELLNRKRDFIDPLKRWLERFEFKPPRLIIGEGSALNDPDESYGAPDRYGKDLLELPEVDRPQPTDDPHAVASVIPAVDRPQPTDDPHAVASVIPAVEAQNNNLFNSETVPSDVLKSVDTTGTTFIDSVFTDDSSSSYDPLLSVLNTMKVNQKESAQRLVRLLADHSKQYKVNLEADDLVRAIGSLGADLQNQPPAQAAAPGVERAVSPLSAAPSVERAVSPLSAAPSVERATTPLSAGPGVERLLSPLIALSPRQATPEPQEQGGEIIGLMNEIMTNLDLRRQNGLEVPAAVEEAFNNLFRGNKVQADELVGWANSLHFLRRALDESNAKTAQLEQQMGNVLLSWHRELADLTPDELEIDRTTGNELQNEISALNAYAQTIEDGAQADPTVVGDLMTRIRQLKHRIVALRVKNRRLNNEVSSLQATSKRSDSLLQEYAEANSELREANDNHLISLRWLNNQNQEYIRGHDALIARNAELLRQLTGASAQAQELQERIDRDRDLNTQLLQQTQDLVQRATQYYNQLGEKDVVIQRLQEDNAELLDQYIQAKREHDTLHQLNEDLVGAAGSTLEALTTIFDQVGVNWHDRDALSVLGELGEYLQNQNIDLQYANARVSDLDRERRDLSQLNGDIIENMTAQKERELKEQRSALETARLTALSDLDRKWKAELEKAKRDFHEQVHERNNIIRALETRNHQISTDLDQRHRQVVDQINLEHEEKIQQLTDNYQGQIAALETDIFNLQSRLDKGVALESGFAHFGPYLRSTLETIKDVLDVDNQANQKHIDKLLDLAVEDLRDRTRTKRRLDAAEYRMMSENQHKQNMSLFNQAQRLGTAQQKNDALAQARAQRANLAWNLVEQMALSPDPTAKANASTLMLSLAKQLINGKGTFEEDEAAAAFLKMYDDGTVGRVVSALATPTVAPVDSALSRKVSDLEASMRNFVSLVSQRTAHVGHAQAYHPPRRVFVGRDGHYYQGNRRARATRAAKSRQRPRDSRGRFTVKKAKK